jgi:GMP synthase-like glutamine amidotransferase
MMRAMPTPPNQAADVLVLQHTTEDTPAYLGVWLDRQGLRWHCPCAETGEAYPASVRGYRALAVLGGEWSANDKRASLRQAEALIREAVALDVPVIGHCLGGQLMARALGGQVTRLPEPEIGWLALQHSGSPLATDWLGAAPGAVAALAKAADDTAVTLTARVFELPPDDGRPRLPSSLQVSIVTYRPDMRLLDRCLRKLLLAALEAVQELVRLAANGEDLL